MIKALRNGDALWYAPDHDYGSHASVFVPYFAVEQAATITGTATLARVKNTVTLPCYNIRTREGYTLHIGARSQTTRAVTIMADASRANREIEAAVRKAPEQYMWLHRRFKTRPNPDDPATTDALPPRRPGKSRRQDRMALRFMKSSSHCEGFCWLPASAFTGGSGGRWRSRVLGVIHRQGGLVRQIRPRQALASSVGEVEAHVHVGGQGLHVPVVVGRRAEAGQVVRRLGLQVLGDDLPRLEGIFMDDVLPSMPGVAAAAGAVVVGHHVELLGRVHGLAVEGEAADALAVAHLDPVLAVAGRLGDVHLVADPSITSKL